MFALYINSIQEETLSFESSSSSQCSIFSIAGKKLYSAKVKLISNAAATRTLYDIYMIFNYISLTDRSNSDELKQE